MDGACSEEPSKGEQEDGATYIDGQEEDDEEGVTKPTGKAKGKAEPKAKGNSDAAAMVFYRGEYEELQPCAVFHQTMLTRNKKGCQCRCMHCATS
jgi:hypothetical protein